MRLFCIFIPLLAVSCTSLPNPATSAAGSNPADAKVTLEQSAATHGNRWKNYRRVDVCYEGKWGTIATRIQPALTDSAFRKSSDESYFPYRRKVVQRHTGPGGGKTVIRTPGGISATYNGVPSHDTEQRDAAALVADAYGAFLFGPSWLLERGHDFGTLPPATLDGESCRLVSGTLKPGLGRADSDRFIVWISEETKLMKRFQFTLNGLASTRGADVDVVFSKIKRAPDGSLWPTHFVEHVQRPLKIKAHEWRMTSLSLDGRKVF